jgi:uncharacterized protein
MQNDRDDLEVLSRAECLRLLATVPIGRLGVSIGALPVILPIRFALLDDAIVVRSARGTKLDTAIAGAVVAFEADHVDHVEHHGWSVLAQGIAEVLTDAAELATAHTLDLRSWTPTHDDRYVRIGTEIMSGRRLSASGG